LDREPDDSGAHRVNHVDHGTGIGIEQRLVVGRNGFRCRGTVAAAESI
jgi:hypothetical protein